MSLNSVGFTALVKFKDNFYFKKQVFHSNLLFLHNMQEPNVEWVAAILL